MPFQKPAEQGWFYHAPARTKNAEPLGVPPASQIPGLSDVSHAPYDEPKRTMFRDSDSNYVRLAKQGGRQDLLQNNYASRGRSKEAVDYPRADWFYLEDNKIEDSQGNQNKDYKFMLPEYMVHEEYMDESNGPNFRPKRAPYGYDREQVYEREHNPTSKDVKLPEVKRVGYGVRTEKLKNKPVPHNQPPPPKPIRHDNNKDYKQVTDASSQISWQRKQQGNDKKSNAKTGDMFATEYQMGFSKAPPKAGRRATPKNSSEKGTISPDQLDFAADGRPPPRTAASGVKKPEPEKELFKMSRFKNVPPRTDSHRPTPVAAGI